MKGRHYDSSWSSKVLAQSQSFENIEVVCWSCLPDKMIFDIFIIFIWISLLIVHFSPDIKSVLCRKHASRVKFILQLKTKGNHSNHSNHNAIFCILECQSKFQRQGVIWGVGPIWKEITYGEVIMIVVHTYMGRVIWELWYMASPHSISFSLLRVFFNKQKKF